MEGKIKAYKGFSVVTTYNEETKSFDRQIQCRGFRFEEGKTYEEPEAILCERGFHACTNPLDVFNYYGYSVDQDDLVEYHIVELEGVSDETSMDSKICGKKITINEKISPGELVDIAKRHVAIPIEPKSNVYIPSCFLIGNNVNDAIPITRRTAMFDSDSGFSYIDFLAKTQNPEVKDSNDIYAEVKELNNLYRRIEPEDFKHCSFWTGVPTQEELENYYRKRRMQNGNTDR